MKRGFKSRLSDLDSRTDFVFCKKDKSGLSYNRMVVVFKRKGFCKNHSKLEKKLIRHCLVEVMKFENFSFRMNMLLNGMVGVRDTSCFFTWLSYIERQINKLK